jgi:HK97 family phage major capsid protein
MGIIGQRFVRKAVNTENAQILGKLAAITDSPTAISTYKGITKALNVTLDPAFYANAKIFTNQDGFEWMSELEDAQNRPLLIPDVAAPDTYRFRGKEVVVISNSILVTSETGTGTVTRKAPMYIGSMSDFLAFFERKGVEVAVSDQAGFTKNATLIRAIERFDTVVADSAAMKSYQVTL